MWVGPGLVDAKDPHRLRLPRDVATAINKSTTPCAPHSRLTSSHPLSTLHPLSTTSNALLRSYSLRLCLRSTCAFRASRSATLPVGQLVTETFCSICHRKRSPLTPKLSSIASHQQPASQARHNHGAPRLRAIRRGPRLAADRAGPYFSLCQRKCPGSIEPRTIQKRLSRTKPLPISLSPSPLTVALSSLSIISAQ
jgi:hypothetical protein